MLTKDFFTSFGIPTAMSMLLLRLHGRECLSAKRNATVCASGELIACLHWYSIPRSDADGLPTNAVEWRYRHIHCWGVGSE